MAGSSFAEALSTVPRIVLCGVLAGAAWTAFSFVILGLVPTPFISEALQARGSSRSVHFVLVGANLVAGCSAVTLHVLARRAGLSFLGSALTAACLWWLIATQQSAKWLAISATPISEAVVVAAVTLPAMVASVLFGGSLFEKQSRRSGGEG
jgi:hypothetical protein